MSRFTDTARSFASVLGELGRFVAAGAITPTLIRHQIEIEEMMHMFECVSPGDQDEMMSEFRELRRMCWFNRDETRDLVILKWSMSFDTYEETVCYQYGMPYNSSDLDLGLSL